MSDPTPKPTEPGKAVALTETQRDDLIVGRLPAALQASLNLRKLQNIAASKLAGTNWGKNLDEGTRRAVAGWCHQHDVDPATEFEILGNKFYKNATWHLRKLGEMAERGIVEYAMADHVQNDLRLLSLQKSPDTAMAQWAATEEARRQRERVLHGIPEESTGACIFRVKLWRMAGEVTGVAWAGGGTKSKVVTGGDIKNSDAFDPIGTAEPIKTTESRAARRAIRKLATSQPVLAEELERGLATAPGLEHRVKIDHDRLKEPTAASGRPVSQEPDPYFAKSPPAAQLGTGAPPPAPVGEERSEAEVSEPGDAAEPDEAPPGASLTDAQQRELDLAFDRKLKAEERA